MRLSKVRRLLHRKGVDVPYSTLHRFAVAELGFGQRGPTIPVADGKPGEEIHIDTGWMQLLEPDEHGKRRRFRAWIFTPHVSRYKFVYPCFAESTETATVRQSARPRRAVRARPPGRPQAGRPADAHGRTACASSSAISPHDPVEAPRAARAEQGPRPRNRVKPSLRQAPSRTQVRGMNRAVEISALRAVDARCPQRPSKLDVVGTRGDPRGRGNAHLADLGRHPLDRARPEWQDEVRAARASRDPRVLTETLGVLGAAGWPPSVM